MLSSSESEESKMISVLEEGFFSCFFLFLLWSLDLGFFVKVEKEEWEVSVSEEVEEECLRLVEEWEVEVELEEVE